MNLLLSTFLLDFNEISFIKEHIFDCVKSLNLFVLHFMVSYNPFNYKNLIHLIHYLKQHNLATITQVSALNVHE